MKNTNYTFLSKIKDKVITPIINFFKFIAKKIKLGFYNISEYFNELIFAYSEKRARTRSTSSTTSAPVYKNSSADNESRLNKTEVFVPVTKTSPDDSGTIIFNKSSELKHLPLKKAPYSTDKSPHSADGKQKLGVFIARKRKPMFAVSVIITTAKVAMIALVVIGMAVLGGVLGVANAYLGTTPELDLQSLQDSELTTYIYDSEGKLITPYAGMENRDYATIDEIPLLLQRAVISVEDVRFYSHSGVDYKSLISAFLNNFTSNSVRGGSTITQQLIKNEMLTSERSYKRKIQEASLAMQLEQRYSKEQILEAYLNTISMGGTNYGVKAAAKDYFDKELGELSLRETACLAGITQYPYLYNPRTAYYGKNKDTAKEALNNKIDIVLKDMYAAGYISIDEYNAALQDELIVQETSDTADMYAYPHFVEYAINNVIDQFLKVRELENTSANRSAIENEIRKSGYSIYTTVDASMQSTLETTIAQYDNYPSMRNSSYNKKNITLSDGTTLEVPQPQVAAVIIDNNTGYVKAMVGSRTLPTIKKSTNRATDSRMPIGSSIKPIAVYGPAFDKGAGLATSISNIKVPIEGWGTASGYPTTSHGKVYGPISIRKGITSSLNIVAAKTLMQHVGVQDSYDYLMRMGFMESKINKDGIGLALGTSGISMLELTSAYSAIANAGEYREPMAFTRVEDRNGNVILSAQDTQEVFQLYEKSSAYMLVSALTDAVNSGTGTRARISGMTVAGKTGTNVENRCVSFAGITPYYTSCVWIGHDDYLELQGGCSGGSTAAPLWQRYMSKILEGYENRPILKGSAASYGVTNVTLCSLSGKLATEYCKLDEANPPITDLIGAGDAPKESCDWHISGDVCKDSGSPVSEFCPSSSIKKGTLVVIPEDSDYLLLPKKELLEIIPNAVLEDTTSDKVCSIHTSNWQQDQSGYNSMVNYAKSMITYANQSLDKYSDRMTAINKFNINKYINELNSILLNSDSTVSKIEQATARLESAVDTALNNLKDDSSSPDASPNP